MARPVVAARRYAEAAFEVALADGAEDALDRWRDDLALAAEVLGGEEVASAVENPALPVAQRLALVTALLESRVTPAGLRLVSLLVERGRASVLPGVAADFARRVNDRRGIVTAVVTSAAPLTPEETEAVGRRVASMADSRIELRTQVDPSLIGGLTVQVGDRLLDASVRGRLERLREKLHAGARLR